jgi:hypothetical protein
MAMPGSAGHRRRSVYYFLYGCAKFRWPICRGRTTPQRESGLTKPHTENSNFQGKCLLACSVILERDDIALQN